MTWNYKNGKMENIKENNELIAKFMGGRFEIIQTSTKMATFPDYKQYLLRNLKYHKKWDWLMPVVEKIESVGFEFNMTGKSNYVYIGDGEKNAFISNKKGKLGNVYGAVVEFVKWYNQNK